MGPCVRRDDGFGCGAIMRDYSCGFKFQTANSVIASQRVARMRARWQAPRSNPALMPRKAGLLRRVAPRNDDKLRLRDLAAQCARVLQKPCPSENRGRRDSRVPAAP